MRHVLKNDRDAIAPPDPFLREAGREPVAEAINIGVGQRRIEIEQCRRLVRRGTKQIESRPLSRIGRSDRRFAEPRAQPARGFLVSARPRHRIQADRHRRSPPGS
ncbi:hypothetical protein RX327_15875 [Bradyrhizobium sp. BEA-2-5]|uniref:hypothetical protein n=1 Tax=Bradyrhizobium sp. BEA-2-5 TaxID=3080015 RepID=UPI00293F372A|nr:hypothetical protein [Bradyrhizobium sp. BEA-2-5]WOH85571.1 hypothetical protein RX327_15875 [Bradyrhizobium sp. BEA-2-5]